MGPEASTWGCMALGSIVAGGALTGGSGTCRDCPSGPPDPDSVYPPRRMEAHSPLPKVMKVTAAHIWKEVQQLNPWLASEAGLEALGTVLPERWRLISAEYQQPAGALYVDVLGTTGEGDTLVIEAQLRQSDHDHLGKLITYSAIYQAAAAVWIVGDARPEHQMAVNALNQAGSTDYFLVKIEGVRVQDSPPAPLLTLITGPAIELKRAGEAKASLTTRGVGTYLAVAALIREGEWSTYGDVARAGGGPGGAARAVAQAAARLPDFPAPHRVLGKGGVIASGWRDHQSGGPEECRTQLEAEGVHFEDGRADPKRHVTWETLRKRTQQAAPA